MGFSRRSKLTYDEVCENDEEDDIDRGFINYKRTRSLPAKTSSLSDQVMINIQDLLEKRAVAEEEERVRVKKDAKIRREWMLAAAVINRFCFICFTVVLIGVSMGFFIMFHLHR